MLQFDQRPTILIQFQQDGDFIRFADFVFQEFGGKGIGFSHVQVKNSLLINQALLEVTKDRFSYVVLTHEQIVAEQAKRPKATQAFDGSTIDYFFGPAQ